MIFLVALLACADPGEPAVTELPRIASISDVSAHDGQRVVVVGTYTQVDVRMRQKPPPQYRGHAAVTLDDGHLVLIGGLWADDYLRPETEREAHDGQRVEVTGTLHAEPPEQAAAMPINPAIHPVERVEGP